MLVYYAKPFAKEIGKGIVNIAASKLAWLHWGAQDPNTIYFFDCTNNGDVADTLRKQGRYVVGGGSFCDRLEMDRSFGQKFAESHGILVPHTKAFGNALQAIAYMRSTTKQELGDGGWAWKPDKDLGAAATMVGDTEKVCAFVERTIIPKHGNNVACIVQERIPGVALSTARWWNGHAWTGPYEGSLEEKKFMNGDIGAATGCSINTVWFYLEDEPKIAQALKWNDLAESFRKYNAPPGLYDINAVVNRQGAYFLEWTPRLGIDSEIASQRGITSLRELLDRLAHGKDCEDLFRVNTAYHAVRVTIPPYPCEAKELEQSDVAMGVAVDGVDSLWNGEFVAMGVCNSKLGLESANPFGYIGSVVIADKNVERGYARIEKAIKKLNIANLQYRTDGAKIITKDIHDMQKAGWTTSPFLEGSHDRAA